MSDHQTQIYQSENGDRWLFCRDNGDDVHVEHRANNASGGRITQLEIAEFLAVGNAGPEHQVLYRMIGTLAGMP